MIILEGLPILSSVEDIIYRLRDDMAANGVQAFHKIKTGPNNLQVTCPIHKEGQENKPSCGINTTGQKTDIGTVHCFTCGYTAKLTELISHCFGYDDEGDYGRKWLVRTFMTVEVEERKPIPLELSRTKKSSIKYVSEAELDEYRYLHPYMEQRGLTPQLIEMFDVGYDPHFLLVTDKQKSMGYVLPSITFPVRDKNGNALFVARRAIHQKLFHYPEGVRKPIYGLYEMLKYKPKAQEIVICESILNAITCWKYGRVGFALLGLGNDQQYQDLKKLGVRKYICAFDPDEAGQAATTRFRNNVDNKIVTYYDIPEGKDVNDLTFEQFKGLQEFF